MRARDPHEENPCDNPTKRLADLELALTELLEITRLRLISARQIQVTGQGYDLTTELKKVKKKLLAVQDLGKLAALNLTSHEPEDEEPAALIKLAEEILTEARNILDTNLFIFKATEQLLQRNTDSNHSSPTLFQPAPRSTKALLDKDSFKHSIHSALQLLTHAASFIVSMIVKVCSAEYDENSYRHRRHTR